MGNHCNSVYIVVTWLFRSEHKPKIPANRRLDPHPDRCCRYTRGIEPGWGFVNFPGFDDLNRFVDTDPSLHFVKPSSYRQPVD